MSRLSIGCLFKEYYAQYVKWEDDHADGVRGQCDVGYDCPNRPEDSPFSTEMEFASVRVDRDFAKPKSRRDIASSSRNKLHGKPRECNT